jgi:hypothetical protein
MAEIWKATFKLKTEEEVKHFQDFLSQQLRQPNKSTASETNIVIESPDENESFVVAHWAKNKNPVGPTLYSVKGYDGEQRVIFDSGCPVCRKEKEAGKSRTPHWEHKSRRAGVAAPAPIVPAGQQSVERELLATVKIGGDGRIRLSPRVLKKLNIKRGQTLAIWFESGKVLLQRDV